ncbi:MAG: glycine--tRNA ligase [Candidatus Pacebacteria bacterium]|nr:glycine--tRNA ligase [Candidatus Paceibacterota bacterium]MDD5721867.1 glycine--tRNA ligase [Candidatus Paceibacterota bacterium]
MNQSDLMEKIISLCKRRGFVYLSSEIYGGLANVYDFGPLGSLLAKNIRDLWIKKMIQERDDIYLIDGSILMHPKAWEASGHTVAFTDPLIQCPVCKKRFRADNLEGWVLEKDNQTGEWEILKQGSLACPDCKGELIPTVKEFNLLMATEVGAVAGEKMKVYLKGESCQNIYLDYLPVRDTMAAQIPFGIGQIGKAFRNEITLGKFLFKVREFEQMDIQYFCAPENADKVYEEWKKIRLDWYLEDIGLNKERLRWRQHTPEERIFYAKDAWDIEYKFFNDFEELEGVHHRSDYDLTQHGKFSGKTLDYFDPQTKKRYVPYIIECSGGLQRTFLSVLAESYREEMVNKDKRVFLKMKPVLAPYKAAVFPLVANKPELTKKAKSVFNTLKPEFMTLWDDIGNIGKRYRRQDEIGTPWCITIDYQTLDDDTVTIRDRDTMKQERIKSSDIAQYIKEKLNNA